MITERNFAPGNAGVPFNTDIICPPLAISFLALAKKRPLGDQSLPEVPDKPDYRARMGIGVGQEPLTEIAVIAFGIQAQPSFLIAHSGFQIFVMCLILSPSNS
jgi:hypothetical protein